MSARVAARERGMILINVLLFVALASAVVVMMLSAEDASLHRTARLTEAGRARAAALGGEASAITALRRDQVGGGDSDNRGEPWGQLTASNVAIRGGRFDLAIADAEDRFNINLLANDDAGSQLLAAKLAGALSLPPVLIEQVRAYLRMTGPVSDVGVIAVPGLPPETQVRLRGLLTALPGSNSINANAIGVDLLGILLDDPVKARLLIELRDRRGFLLREDFAVQGISVPPILAFTSQTFWVRTRVTIGDTTQTLTSLLRRSNGHVRPIGRWWGAGAPGPAPR
ncbi:type II secretion system protein GspK [Sphingomonas naphthae]|uniref:Type II secretion system protein GspK n=1 Tax=Sphingomonas naphthae TaxID=1813468 RepID=A0ABY7TIW1_9SPHN|nr:type II secretion system protein GspK [Sphingomonas naphthae]WCT72870.1 type II secretion system protein GspK [Sphingomonas naphthae]